MSSNATGGTDGGAWVVVPVFFGVLLYCALALASWPYARRAVPIWAIVLCIFVPPFFPFLLFYLLLVALAPLAPPVVVVVDAPTRGRIAPTRAPARGARV